MDNDSLMNIQQQLEYLSWIDMYQNSDNDSYITIRTQRLLQRIRHKEPIRLMNIDTYDRNILKALRELHIIKPLDDDSEHRYQFTPKGGRSIKSIESTPAYKKYPPKAPTKPFPMLRSLFGLLFGIAGIGFSLKMMGEIDITATPSFHPLILGLIGLMLTGIAILSFNSAENSFPDPSVVLLPVTTAVSERNFLRALLINNFINREIIDPPIRQGTVRSLNSRIRQIINHQMFQ